MTCPLPRYWLCHMAIAALIMAGLSPFIGVPGAAVAGAMFYVGREVRDREKLG